MVAKKKAKAKAKTAPKKTTKKPVTCHAEFKEHYAKGGLVYFLGFLGAAVFYITAATSFWMGV